MAPPPPPAPTPSVSAPAIRRHYGLDWLRVAAFGILILYHVGMVFVPWPYHAKLAREDWVAPVMMLANSWRLALLFLVAGYASRALLSRGGGAGAFAAGRSKRLLIPLAFGMAVVNPPQPWVELVTQHGYGAGFWQFLTRDYFGFRAIDGIVVPTWQHLWFVVYLWAYSMLLALGLACLPARAGTAVQAGYDRLFGGWPVLVLPMAWLVAVSALLFPGARETHALVGDWVAHASYLPLFLFGVGLAGSRTVLPWLARRWVPLLLLAVAAWCVVAGIERTWPRSRAPYPYGLVYAAMRGVQGWAAIVGLLGMASRHWNRDHPWRGLLTEAVFPFYVVHQTLIVVGAWWLTGAGLPGWAEFALLVAGTAAGCWLFYLVGRRVGPLRPLIGLKART